MGLILDSCVWVGIADGTLEPDAIVAVRSTGRSPRPRNDDVWIAAQAIEHGHALMTVNTRHITNLPGLRLITPQSA